MELGKKKRARTSWDVIINVVFLKCGEEGTKILFGAMVFICCFIYFPQHFDDRQCYSHFTDRETETWRGCVGGQGNVSVGKEGIDVQLPSPF